MAQFAYFIAGFCSLYLALGAFLTSSRITLPFLVLGFWSGAVLLILAAVLPPGSRKNTLVHPLALLGSSVTTVLMFVVISRMGYGIRRGQIPPYAPNAFDRFNDNLILPVLVLLLISSLASLVFSGLITLRQSKGE